jgi:hypothetical protein
MNIETRREEVVAGAPAAAAQPVDSWKAWPVYWSAVWVGALAALATALVIGLIGTAVGAHVVNADPWVELTKVGFWALVFSVVAAFFAFVVGGWVAGKIAGIRRSETAMLHGAIVWLVAVPLLLAGLYMGAGSSYGGWYGGLTGRPTWAVVQEMNGRPTMTAEQKENAAKVARNTATGAVTALLLGLIGGVLGGWLASGEPMSVTYYRRRHLAGSGTGY